MPSSRWSSQPRSPTLQADFLPSEPPGEKAMATHSSILAWKIPWTEVPGRLQSIGSQRVRHDWETSLSLSCIGEGNGNPLQCSCLENLRDGRAWWAAIYSVTQSWTRLTRLSRSSSSSRATREAHEYWSRSPIPSPGASSLPRSQTRVSCIAGRLFTSWATREVHIKRLMFTLKQ